MNHMLQNMVKLEILATSPIASSRPIGLVFLEGIPKFTKYIWNIWIKVMKEFRNHKQYYVSMWPIVNPNKQLYLCVMWIVEWTILDGMKGYPLIILLAYSLYFSSSQGKTKEGHSRLVLIYKQDGAASESSSSRQGIIRIFSFS